MIQKAIETITLLDQQKMLRSVHFSKNPLGHDFVQIGNELRDTCARYDPSENDLTLNVGYLTINDKRNAQISFFQIDDIKSVIVNIIPKKPDKKTEDLNNSRK